MNERGHLLIPAPPVNGHKKKQPYHIHKVPIPCSSFKAKVMVHCKVLFVYTYKAHEKKNGANKYVEAMKTGG
jgi:hypothetical protein